MEAVPFLEKTQQRWIVQGHIWQGILPKNMVAAGLAEKCLVSLAYAIGVAEPVMVQVDTFGTGTVCADDCLAAAIPLVFGLTPKQIIDHFKLQRPIYSQTAVFGHLEERSFRGNVPIR